MLALRIGTFIARTLLWILPRPWVDRMLHASEDIRVQNFRTGEIHVKPRMTLFEAVVLTMLFDLALFGTDNWVINGIIRTFTKLLDSWDRRFQDPVQAETQIREFCSQLNIQLEPWIWSKPIHEYISLNDFFARQYHPKHTPELGKSKILAPACSIVSIYRNDDRLKNLLIKGCDYKVEEIGFPDEDLGGYRNNHVLIGYLSPSHYHRVHSPMSGRLVHLKLEGATALSASVKFWEGRFNLLNRNKRLIAIIEEEGEVAGGNKAPLRVALVIIGGVGVNTIAYDQGILGKLVRKGDEISAFRGGGSAFAMFSNQELAYDPKFLKLADAENETLVEVLVGESLTDT